MNSSPLLQTIGNICVGLAAFIYALPLQALLFELSHKRNDHGQGTIVGFFLLVPMWLFLLAALWFVTASGGFDGLRLSRRWLYPLLVAAILSMLALSILCFEFPRHSSFTTRLIGRLPVYIFPVATMLLVVLNLNPNLAPNLPLKAIQIPWTICAVLALTLCGGYLSYRLVATGGNQIAGLAHQFRWQGNLDKNNLAEIPMLAPQRPFGELLKRTNEYESRAVREAALAPLRSHPDFVTQLVAELTEGSVSSGAVNHAVATVDFASFTPEEQHRLALPARTAMERVTSETRKEFRYIPKDRRKAIRRWGNRLFTSIAAKLQGADVDFQLALAAFEETFTTFNPDAE
jgi:hypothetical protein